MYLRKSSILFDHQTTFYFSLSFYLLFCLLFRLPVFTFFLLSVVTFAASSLQQKKKHVAMLKLVDGGRIKISFSPSVQFNSSYPYFSILVMAPNYVVENYSFDVIRHNNNTRVRKLYC